MKSNNFLTILDVETTGLSPQYDWIIQLSATKLDKATKKVVSTWNRYIIPAGKWYITPEATEVHGLTEEFIKANGQTLKQCGPEFIEYLKDSDIGGYNSNLFDIKFLYKDFAHSGLQFPMDDKNFYDVLKIEQRLHPNNLGAVFQRYTGKTMEEAGLTAHDSAADVSATAIVLLHQMEANNLTFDELDQWDENILISPDGSVRNASRDGYTLVFANGKYRDRDIYAVMNEDPDYCRWWSKNVASTYTINKVRKYCIEKKNKLMS